MPIIGNISSGAGNVVSTATNLEIKDVLRIKMKKKKNIRKQKKMKIKTENLTGYASIATGKGM